MAASTYESESVRIRNFLETLKKRLAEQQSNLLSKRLFMLSGADKFDDADIAFFSIKNKNNNNFIYFY
jgi:hypothetical protein